ncbi:hypothetical protein OAR04_01840 [Flavobacteriales bacterium]|nr:hypothetical protein [Flavobacteriales bacterium]
MLKIWPSAILGCLIFSLAGDSEYKKICYLFIFIWMIIGVISYSFNGKTHLKETLITNVLACLLIVIIIALIALPYYISFPLLALLLYLYFKWTN